jgi:chorismate dehydratase
MSADWARVMTADGCPTLCHPHHGQSSHDSGGAWAEAQQLHVAGCDIARRLLKHEAVRLLEVGAAPGWNLAAAYFLTRGLPGQMEVTAVERSPEALRAGSELSLDNSWKHCAPHGAADSFDAIHAGLEMAGAPETLGTWVEVSPNFRLRLFLEEASAVVAGLPSEDRFDGIFLDAFSPGVDPGSWSVPFLRAIAERIAVKGRLTTFTVAQGVRAALLAGGLNVGRAGVRSGRHGGTWASREGWVPPLDERLSAKLKRRSGRLEATEGWVQAASHLE